MADGKVIRCEVMSETSSEFPVNVFENSLFNRKQFKIQPGKNEQLSLPNEFICVYMSHSQKRIWFLSHLSH